MPPLRPTRQRGLWMLGIVALLVLAGIATYLLVPHTNNQSPTSGNNSNQPQGLSVTGDGTVYATPDIAKFQFGVQQTGKDAATVQDQIATKIDSVKAKLKDLDIDDKDIKTVEFGIYPDYNSTGNQVRSYTGRHMLEVTIRDLDKADEISGAVVTAGANQVQNIQFTVENPDQWYQQARTQAIQQAKDKAKQLADAAGIKLGKLLSINEYTSNGPIYYADTPAGYGVGGGPMPTKDSGVEPGSLELHANVTLVYDIR